MTAAPPPRPQYALLQLLHPPKEVEEVVIVVVASLLRHSRPESTGLALALTTALLPQQPAQVGGM